MSVKPQQFQQTKQTILKNKQQFIQIQLKQINKRIGALKNENNALKGQIKQLKNKPTNMNGRSSRKISICPNKSNNVSTNGNSSFITNREFTCNKENLCANRRFNDNDRIQTKDCSLLNQICGSQQICQYQQSLAQQQQTKQKQLKNLQQHIESLKKIWQQKQSISTNRKLQQMPSKQMSTSFNRSFTEMGKQRQKQKQKGKEVCFNIETFRNKNVLPKNDDVMSMQTMRQREGGDRNCQSSGLNCLSFINMAQQSASFIDNSYSNIQQPSTQIRRKTMSLSLNNSMSETPGFSNGFNFGKKIQTKNPKQFPNVSMQIHPHLNPHLNNSTKTSILSHTQSSKQLQLNRSGMKMSRSYAKIVTKLHCCGCNNQYRPNQYYNHIKECRPYIKIKLMEERECIHRQICGGSQDHIS